MRRVSLAIFGLIVALGVAGGVMLSCRPTVVVAPPSPGVTGPFFADRDSISPSTPPPKKATLTLSGSPFEVTVKTTRKGTFYEIVLVKDEEEFDREEYEDSFQAFRLLQAGGEDYKPPIDLLRFPMTVGETWDWNGVIDAYGNSKKAEAKIETSQDKTIVGGVPVESVRVTVTLKFLAVGSEDEEDKEAAQRVLTFWFTKDQGLFRRQYDWVSVREPAK